MMQFNTHEVFKQLKDAGLQDKIADAVVNAINEARVVDLDNLSTTHDISDVRKDIANTELKLELKIADVKSELGKEIADVKSDVARLDGKVDKLQWMVTFTIGLLVIVLGVVLKLAFSH